MHRQDPPCFQPDPNALPRARVPPGSWPCPAVVLSLQSRCVGPVVALVPPKPLMSSPMPISTPPRPRHPHVRPPSQRPCNSHPHRCVPVLLPLPSTHVTYALAATHVMHVPCLAQIMAHTSPALPPSRSSYACQPASSMPLPRPFTVFTPHTITYPTFYACSP